MFSQQRTQEQVYEGLGISKLISRVIDVGNVCKIFRGIMGLYLLTGKPALERPIRWKELNHEMLELHKEVLKSFMKKLRWRNKGIQLNILVCLCHSYKFIMRKSLTC